MKKIYKYILLFLININIFSNEYIDYQDILLGSIGNIKTVLKGEKIEDISIKIITILKDENSNSDMLLFQMIDNNTFVSEGMSGSPVYINNKLIGSVAYALKDNRKYGLIKPVNYFEKYPQKELSTEVLPGTSIAISPTRGDIFLDNIGTLTYVDKLNNVYIYSHGLNEIGDIKYYLNKAHIDFVYNDINNSFKIGHSTKTIGEISSDTKIGFKGKINNNISEYKFLINLVEKDSENKKKIQYNIIKNENTLRKYLEESLSVALQKNVRKKEYKTVKYKYKIFNKNGYKIFEESNILIAENGIINGLANTLSNSILNVVDNKFKYIDFDKIEINIDFYDESKIMYLNEINLDKKIFVLGEKINIKLGYLIHQVGNVEKIIEFEIPNNIKIGKLTLEALVNEGKNNEQAKNIVEYLYNLENNIQNNELLIQLKNEEGEVIFMKKYNFDYYIISNNNYSKDIIIDSFEASTSN
ncbi:SpoIVB peptidase S55 [Hypnocyclicus thermotrophus]|uniref:SpoIVB peptidase S55 n=1 Tax=Hypnocyclicus thermotrophus TaxID=1627895 RepID=A0AA46I660_9FUSO|nr:SpoIVB peptidase S55 domain-containing protein [Hypnocyclicus thermotrophus]TDT71805.1 SpoIVB peptidase S55 [Hypnocyclicus thermotrophus]